MDCSEGENLRREARVAYTRLTSHKFMSESDEDDTERALKGYSLDDTDYAQRTAEIADRFWRKRKPQKSFRHPIEFKNRIYRPSIIDASKRIVLNELLGLPNDNPAGVLRDILDEKAEDAPTPVEVLRVLQPVTDESKQLAKEVKAAFDETVTEGQTVMNKVVRNHTQARATAEEWLRKVTLKWELKDKEFLEDEINARRTLDAPKMEQADLSSRVYPAFKRRKYNDIPDTIFDPDDSERLALYNDSVRYWTYKAAYDAYDANHSARMVAKKLALLAKRGVPDIQKRSTVKITSNIASLKGLEKEIGKIKADFTLSEPLSMAEDYAAARTLAERLPVLKGEFIDPYNSIVQTITHGCISEGMRKRPDITSRFDHVFKRQARTISKFTIMHGRVCGRVTKDFTGGPTYPKRRARKLAHVQSTSEWTSKVKKLEKITGVIARWDKRLQNWEDIATKILTPSDSLTVYESELLSRMHTDAVCPICREHAKETCVLPCLHAFCKWCIGEHIKGRNRICPSCQGRFDPNRLIDIHDDQAQWAVACYQRIDLDEEMERVPAPRKARPRKEPAQKPKPKRKSK